MLRFLADENFNNDILRGLRLRQPDLDIVRIQDVGLDEATDPEVLAWAATQDRLVLTHDRTTFPDHAYNRVTAGEPMPGVVVVNDRLAVGRAIEEIRVVATCSQLEEWRDKVLRLPM